uniref:pH-response regulator protein palC n=1 Tax=Melanopsichium pennsylvanicum 4 TaxID=1398559 RepID=A0A077R7R9_9BASI|nr:conserved hypothetical protein [Melanopsichium pennsylvanicum 4]
MYVFDLPTTGNISLSDFLVTTDLHSQVGQTTQLRAHLRAVLKENRAGTSSTSTSSLKQSTASKSVDIGIGTGSSSDTARKNGGNGANPGEWLLIVKAIEEYLPNLLAIFNSVQTDDLILRYDPVFSWRTTISSTRFRGAIRIDLAGLHYELCFTLLTYALTLSNFAAATVASLGCYETDRNISSADRKQKDDRLKWSADTLCRAAGILLYLSQDLLPKWRDAVGSVQGLPLDLTSEATLGLSKMCLAEAQALAIRKLVSPAVANATDTITPGPPLDKAHPSASLLAKLHLAVVEEMESAQALLRTVGEKSKSGMHRRMSAGREHHSRIHDGDDDDDDSPPINSVGNGTYGGAGENQTSRGGQKKLFGKFKLGSSSSNKNKDTSRNRTSGPRDVAGTISSSSAAAVENSFYAPPTTSSSISGGLDQDLNITPSLVKYLSFSITFHRAMAFKWLGIDSGEASSKVGVGIAFLSLSFHLLSSSSLKDLSSGLSNISISSSASFLPGGKSSSRTKLKSERSVVQAELMTVTHWLESYRKLNDTVSFECVPAAGEVQARIPAGRGALGIKLFKLPTPLWGPGSEGYRGRGGEGGVGLAKDELHLLDLDHPARSNLVALEVVVMHMLVRELITDYNK